MFLVYDTKCMSLVGALSCGQHVVAMLGKSFLQGLYLSVSLVLLRSSKTLLLQRDTNSCYSYHKHHEVSLKFRFHCLSTCIVSLILSLFENYLAQSLLRVAVYQMMILMVGKSSVCYLKES